MEGHPCHARLRARQCVQQVRRGWRLRAAPRAGASYRQGRRSCRPRPAGADPCARGRSRGQPAPRTACPRQWRAPGASGSMRKLQWVRKLKLVSELARELNGPALIADAGEPGTFSWNAHVLGAPGYQIAGGSDQIQRNIVAERHLGLPAEPKPAASKENDR
ncbi:acyl-CoA dehydrogenase family protein [Nocardioides alcanivorans]|uniref:acyl-CoA dehydrogenase family protein n=1 Tax=Nocardioides alcanivorans TaxID=2897352 RepID=UPI0035D909B9